MCGIAGAAAVSRRSLVDAPALVERMRGELVHRGPDGSGQWGDDHVVLGHQRLSILDVTDAGAQPMFSASGRLVIAFNGEIYNFKELAEQLTETGWTSTSASDTEVLIECIERWGLDTTLDRVDGMFAFVLYDRQRQELVLCRDRFGEKPLYYGVQNGVIYFASELKAFDVPGGPELLLDQRATTDYFRYGFIPAPLSIYNGFFKVRPAHLIRIDLSGGGVADARELPSQPYWSIPGPSDGATSSEEELCHILRRSVNRRLVSDRPIGAFLSGGIDSSLTCALAAESMSGSLKTFNMGWANQEYDESEHAEEVASALGTVHHRVEVSINEVATIASKVGNLLDEPLADSSFIATYLVAREARRDFVVALSGDGGDELFAGYNRHHWLLQTSRLRKYLPLPARRTTGKLLEATSPLLGKLARPIPLSRRPRLVSNKATKLGRALSADGGRTAYESVVSIHQGIFGYLDMPSEVAVQLETNDRSTLLWALRAADVSSYLPNDVLAKVDRASMAVSLETRTPFLEPVVAQAAFGLSYDELFEDGKGKQPLRKLLGELLPGQNFARPKSGFGTPIEDVLRGPLVELVFQSVNSFNRRELPFGIRDKISEDFAERFQNGDDSLTFPVWSVLVFELWCSARQHEIKWV